MGGWGWAGQGEQGWEGGVNKSKGGGVVTKGGSIKPQSTQHASAGFTRHLFIPLNPASASARPTQAKPLSPPKKTKHPGLTWLSLSAST